MPTANISVEYTALDLTAMRYKLRHPVEVSPAVPAEGEEGEEGYVPAVPAVSEVQLASTAEVVAWMQARASEALAAAVKQYIADRRSQLSDADLAALIVANTPELPLS